MPLLTTMWSECRSRSMPTYSRSFIMSEQKSHHQYGTDPDPLHQVHGRPPPRCWVVATIRRAGQAFLLHPDSLGSMLGGFPASAMPLRHSVKSRVSEAGFKEGGHLARDHEDATRARRRE